MNDFQFTSEEIYTCPAEALANLLGRKFVFLDYGTTQNFWPQNTFRKSHAFFLNHWLIKRHVQFSSVFPSFFSIKDNNNSMVCKTPSSSLDGMMKLA